MLLLSFTRLPRSCGLTIIGQFNFLTVIALISL